MAHVFGEEVLADPAGRRGSASSIASAASSSAWSTVTGGVVKSRSHDGAGRAARSDHRQDDEICRVCRCESTPQQPLFYPCKCSGSIKYVHQDCLVEWLSHSKKKYCELCNHPFSFTPIYDPKMPEQIPLPVFLRRVLKRFVGAVQAWLRGLLVGTVWIVLLPFITVWTWRLYFWTGSSFAYSFSGQRGSLEKALAAVAANSTAFGVYNASWALNETTAAKSNSEWLVRGIPLSQALWIIMSDCAEGLVITFGVVVTFVAVFLMREWLVRNTHQGIPAAPGADMAIHAHAPDADAIPEMPPFAAAGHAAGVTVQPREQPDPMLTPEFQSNSADVSWSSESAVVGEGEVDGQRPVVRRRHTHVPEAPPVAKGASLSMATTAGGPSSSSSTDPGIRNSEHDGNSAAMQGVHPLTRRCSTGTISHERSGSSQRSRPHKKGSYGPWEDRVAELWSDKSLIYTEDPTSEEVSPERDSVVENLLAARSLRTPVQRWMENISDDEASTSTGRPDVSWKGKGKEFSRGEPPESENCHEKFSDDHQEFVDNDHYENGKIPLIFGRRASSSAATVGPSRPSFLGSKPSGAKPSGDDMTAILERSARSRGALAAHEFGEGERTMQGDRGEPDEVHDDVRNHPPPVLNVANVAPGVAANAEAAAAVDEEEFIGDDLEGFMEAIGVHGPLWTLVQNFLLLTFLIAVIMWFGVFVPYVIGKTVYLIDPVDVLYIPHSVLMIIQIMFIPLKLLRYVSDPVIDLIIDIVPPQVWRPVSFMLTSSYAEVSSLISAALPKNMISASLRHALEGSRGWSRILGKPVRWVGSLLGNPLTNAPGNFSTDSAVPAYPDISPGSFASMDGEILYDVPWRTSLIKHGFWSRIDTPSDKLACVSLGYLVVFALMAWYLSATRNIYGRTVGNAVTRGIRMTMTGVKVLSFLAIELVVFPIGCGILVDLSLLPISTSATVSSRWRFHQAAPYTSTFLHWFLGTVLVYYVAFFVSLCREIVRPGLLWWIKDPTDPNFQPIREILERPALEQVKKIGASAVVYASVIAVGIGSVVFAVATLGRGKIFPLRLEYTEPIWDFPLDLLIVHIMLPAALRWLSPKELLTTAVTNWWHTACRWLRLTSFMFGGRYPEEEGTHVRTTLWAKVTLARSPVMSLEDISAARNRRPMTVNDVGGKLALDFDIRSGRELSEEAMQASERGVTFVPDGGLVRAPGYDGVAIPSDRVMLVRVREDGVTRMSDSSEATAGRKSAVPAEGITPPVSSVVNPIQRPIAGTEPGTDRGFVIVYVPPNFRPKVLLFTFLLWLYCAILACSVTLLPLLTGRFFCDRSLGRPVHDVYSFLIGTHLVIACAYVTHTASRAVESLQAAEWWKSEWRLHWLRKARAFVWKVISAIYVVLAVVGLLAFQIGAVGELYIFNTLRALASAEPVNTASSGFYLQTWACGVLYLKLLHKLLVALHWEDINRMLDEVFGGGLTEIDADLATKLLIVPGAGWGIVAMYGPYLVSILVIIVLGVGNAGAQQDIINMSYPATLATGLLYCSHERVRAALEDWLQSVRDDEYLIGQQLNSLDREPPTASTAGLDAGVREPATRSDEIVEASA